MPPRRALLLAAALIALAAVFAVAILPRRESALAGAGSSPVASPAEPAPDATPAAAGESRVAAAEGPGAAAPADRAEAVPGLVAGRVEGRLALPPGGDPPAGARVYLLPKDPTPASGKILSGLMSEAFTDPTVWTKPSKLPRRGKPRPEDPSADVAPDGSFAIAAPQKEAEYWAHLEADYYFQDRAPRVRTDAAGFATGVLVPVLQGGRLAGTLRAKDGSPVAGAEIRASRNFDPFSILSGAQPELLSREAKSDAAGNWSIGGIRPGKDLVLTAKRDGHGPLLRPGLEVLPARETRVEATLPAEAIVTGVVVEEGGHPIAGAEVAAVPVGELAAMLAAAGDSVESSEDGSFRLKGLGAGDFRVGAEKEGWKKAKPAKVPLEEGERKAGVRLVLLEGNSISGRVLDPKGAPAEGVAVSARFEASAFTMSDPDLLAGGASGRAKSGKDGAFRIAGLGKGPFKVRAVDEAKASAEVGAVKPGVKDLELRLRASGGLAGIVTNAKTGEPVPSFSLATLGTEFGMLERKREEKEFRSAEGAFKWTGLPPGTYTISVEASGYAPRRVNDVAVKEGATTPGLVLELLPESVVEGRVLAAGTGAPVEGAEVSAGAGGAFGMFQTMTGGRPSARTGEKGEFRLSGLGSGDVSFAASHPDFAGGQSASLRLEPGTTVRDVEILLAAGGGIDGFVQGKEGRPVSGSWVMASTPAATAFRSSQSDERGYFLMKGLAPGSYQVTAFPMRFDAAMDPEAMQELLQGMHVAVAEVEEGRVTRVLLGDEEEGGVRVRGKVLSGDRPVAGAILSVVPSGAGGGLRFRTAVSAENGAYAIEGVRPGANTVTVQRVDASAGGFTAIEIPIEVPDGKEYERDLLLPVASVSGRVTDARTGEPLEGMRVSLQREDRDEGGLFGGGFFESQTAGDGTYRFEGVKPGTYTVAAGGATFFGSNPKGLGRAVRDGLAIGEATVLRGIDLALRPGGTVAGTVRDAAGHPVEGASIFFRDADGRVVNRMSEIFTDRGGLFRAPGLGEGTYRVFARASGAGFGSSEGVRVRAGEETSASLVLYPGTDLVARAEDPDGKPIAGASASLFDAEGHAVSGLLGVADFVEIFRKGLPGPGEIRVGTYPPGSYRLRVAAAGFRAKDIAVSLSGDAVKRVEVRLERD